MSEEESISYEERERQAAMLARVVKDIPDGVSVHWLDGDDMVTAKELTRATMKAIYALWKELRETGNLRINPEIVVSYVANVTAQMSVAWLPQMPVEMQRSILRALGRTVNAILEAEAQAVGREATSRDA